MLVISIYLILLVYICYLLIFSSISYRIQENINNLFPRPKVARQLTIQIQEMISYSNINLRAIELVQFKFYSKFIKELISFSRQYGTPINSPLREISKAISKEEKSLSRIWGVFIGGIAQYLVVSLVTWIFVYLLETMVNFQVSSLTIYMVIIIQGLGLIVYFISFYVCYSKIMGGFENAFFSIYTMRSLLLVGMPISKTLKVAQIENFPNKKRFHFIHKRLILLTGQAVKHGGELTTTLNDIVEDLWAIHEDSFDSFNKVLTTLKFFTLLFFFLPSYLIVIYDLITSLNI